MLSSRLIQRVQDHWEQITTRAVEQIRHDPELFHLGKLPEAELREWGQGILQHLGHWLVGSSEHEIAKRFESLGRMRYQELIPMHEAVRGIHILKECMLDYVRDQGISNSAIDLYAEEELEHSVGRFFDSLSYHFVRGYEVELRHAAHIGAM